MSKLNSTGFDLLNSLFSPSLAVFSSPDVESICAKNNLNFVELVKPFSKITKDVILKDPNNANHTLKDLQIIFQYINGYLPQPAESTKIISDVVGSQWKEPVMTYINNQTMNVTLPASTPWYDAYMHTFLSILPVSEHEFLRHCLGCVFVVSTSHPDPVLQFSRLTQQQNQLQMQQLGHGGHVRWFHHNIMKFYVLVHDCVDGPEKAHVDLWYQTMKSTYGATHCHLLPINSRPLPTTPSDLDAIRIQCDPWQQFLLPIGLNLEGTVAPHLCTRPNVPTTPTATTSINESLTPTTSSPGLTNSDSYSTYSGVGASSVVDFHPLASTDSEIDDISSQDTLSSSSSNFSKYSKTNSSPDYSSNIQTSPLWPLLSISPFYTLVPCTSSMLTQTLHGQCLTEEDYEKLRLFVYDLTVKALIPWVEKTMKSLHDQLNNRIKSSRSLINVRKWFGGGGGSNNTTTAATTAPLTSVAVAGGAANKLSPTNSLNSLNTIQSASSASLFGSVNSSTSGYRSISSASGGGSVGGLPVVHSAVEPLSSMGIGNNNPLSSTLGTISPANSMNQLSAPSSGTATGSAVVVTSTASTTVYSQDAPELQLRRYADIAFLFQQYEVAHSTYDLLRKDFKSSSAWLYYAGVMECDALTLFIQNPHNQYSHSNLEQAVNHYLYCRNVAYAARAIILHTQTLQSRGLFAEASGQFMKLTVEDCDLRSGLFLEQSAYCYARLRIPQLRKYAFRLVMAGHRFSKSGQKQHSIRAYSQAYQIYQGRSWQFIDDHINRALAQQSALLKQLPQSLKFYQNMLISLNEENKEKDSVSCDDYASLHHHSPEVESNLLRDYLFIYKQYLQNMIGNDRRLLNSSLPEINLPLLKPICGIQVMLGKPQQDSQTNETEARGIQFHDHDILSTEWSKLEKQLVTISTKPGEFIPEKSTPSTFCMTQDTDNSKNLPRAVVSETITVFIPLENPLQVPLILRQISLLWKLTLSSEEMKDGDKESTIEITNEVELNELPNIQEMCSTEILQDFYLLPRERKSLQLSVVPHQAGILHIYGVAYQLNHMPPRIPVSTANSIIPIPPVNNTATSSTSISSNSSVGTSTSNRVTTDYSSSISTNNENIPAQCGDYSLLTSKSSSASSSTEGNHVTLNFKNTTSLWCKMNLTTRGKRLNLTKEQRATVTYAKDYRLNLQIVPAMPLLKVTFINMPTTLLYGQVHPVQMQIMNIGSQPLTCLSLGVNESHCISFGMADSHENNVNHPFIYPPAKSTKDNECELNVDLHRDKHHYIQLINKTSKNNHLSPGCSRTFTFWLRGYPNKSHSSLQNTDAEDNNNIGPLTGTGASTAAAATSGFSQEEKDVLFLKMLFYYEGCDNNSSLRYRLLRHRSRIPLIPSINLQAQAGRAKSGDPQSIFIDLQANNSLSAASANGEVHILQVTGASSRWSLQPVTSCPPLKSGSIVLKCRESINLYLRGFPIQECADDNVDDKNNKKKNLSMLMFSNVPWSESGVNSQSTPAADFYFRSHVPWYCKQQQQQQTKCPSDRDNNDSNEMQLFTSSNLTGPAAASLLQNAGEAFQVHLTLIVFWKVVLVDDSAMYGQTHIHIPLLDQMVYEPSSNTLLNSTSVRPLSFTTVSSSSATNPRLQLQPLLLQSKMISLSLHHPSELEHNFTQQRLVTVPVEAKLYNASLLPTVVRLEGLGTDARQRRNTVVSQSVAIGLVSSQTTALNDTLNSSRTVDSRSPTFPHHPTHPHHHHHPHHHSSSSSSLPYSTILRTTAQFSWVGLSQRRLILQPHESRTVRCYACFPRPGTYELSHLDLKAALLPDNLRATDELTFVKQEAVFSSLIMIKSKV